MYCTMIVWVRRWAGTDYSHCVVRLGLHKQQERLESQEQYAWGLVLLCWHLLGQLLHAVCRLGWDGCSSQYCPLSLLPFHLASSSFLKILRFLM